MSQNLSRGLENEYLVPYISFTTHPQSGSIIGGGTTTIRRVFVKVDGNGPHGLSTTSGISTSDYMGTYSWGRIDLTSRAGLNSYTAYTESGITGITTSLIVERSVPLKYKGYKEI